MIKVTCLVAFAGLSTMPLVAQAQSYPARSITVVVPFPAGGPSDVVARIVTEHMGRTLGQQMVIENVGGAGGTLGSARVAAAQPDGYTLLAGSMGSHVAAPVLTPNVKYDSARDFEPIGLTANAPAVIVARKDFPAENLSEFVAYLKENGDKLKQAHGGIGASSHMACLLFNQALEPIREVLESNESDVIHCWALDSLESARCGSPNTALRRTAVAFVTRAI